MFKRTLESNIWKYTLFLITNKRVYIPILGVYLLTLPDATAKTIGLMNLISNFTGFAFEVPSGYISDKIGHKKALIFARLCYVTSTTLFLIGSSVPIFILGAVFMNIGVAFQSGTTAAFMHETIKELGREDEYTKIISKSRSIGFGVPIIFLIVIPLLVGISYKAAFAAALFIDLIGLIVTLSFVSPKKTKEQIEEIQIYNFKQVLKDGYQYGYYKYAFFTGIIYGSAVGVSTFKDVYQAFLGVPIVYFGIFWAISRVLISIILWFNDKIKDTLSLNQFLFFKMVLSVGLILCLGVFSVPWVVVTVFILASAFAHSFDGVQSHLMHGIITKSNFKATLISIKALIATIITGIVSFGIGLMVDASGFDKAFVALAITLSLFLLPLYIYIVARGKPQAH